MENIILKKSDKLRCPECGSPNLQPADMGNHHNALPDFLYYECKDCGNIFGVIYEKKEVG